MLTEKLLKDLLDRSIQHGQRIDSARASKALYMVRVEGKKYREVADELDTSATNAGQLVRRAERMLRVSRALFTTKDLQVLWECPTMRRQLWREQDKTR